MKSKLLVSFLVSFLLGFMLLIFDPAEIFFGNVTEFEFLYGEFAGYLAIIFGIALAGYLQVMFLNKNLDLLGVNPDGYHVQASQGTVNLIIWLVVIAGIIALSVWKKEIWKKLVLYLSAFLLYIQEDHGFAAFICKPSIMSTNPKQNPAFLRGVSLV